SALAFTVLSSDLANSSGIKAIAMIAKIALEKSSAVRLFALKRATVFGHFEVITLAQLSGLMEGSLPTSVSSALAAVSVVIALTNLSILSRRSVVRGMAPAALSWSGGTSARRAGAKVNAAIMQKSVKNKERLRFIV